MGVIANLERVYGPQGCKRNSNDAFEIRRAASNHRCPFTQVPDAGAVHSGIEAFRVILEMRPAQHERLVWAGSLVGRWPRASVSTRNSLKI